MNSLFWAFLVLNFMFPTTGTPVREAKAPKTDTTKSNVEASVSSSANVGLSEKSIEQIKKMVDKTYETLKESLTVYEKQSKKAKAEASEDKPSKSKAKSTTKTTVEYTEEEREILYRIVEAEATDGTIQQKKNVASCILARVASNSFPNTIKGVVFEKGQFSPLKDGRYYSVKITDSTKEAVDEILANGREHDYLFFCSYGCKSSYFAKKDEVEEPMRDGIHRYYLK